MRVGFADIGREVGPGEEFDVPPELALSFAEHGHCTCLEPEKLEPLRAAQAAEQQAQDAARAAAGLVNAHPAAQAAEAAKTASAPAEPPATLPDLGHAAEESAPAVDQAAEQSEQTPPAAAVKKSAKAGTSATATAK